jgi:hypothetical protein
MKKESGLKSGLLNDAIFTGVIMTLRDDTEDEKAPPCQVRANTHYALRTTSSTGSHLIRRSNPLQ